MLCDNCHNATRSGSCSEQLLECQCQANLVYYCYFYKKPTRKSAMTLRGCAAVKASIPRRAGVGRDGYDKFPFSDTRKIYTLKLLPRCITISAPVIPGPLDPTAGKSPQPGSHLELPPTNRAIIMKLLDGRVQARAIPRPCEADCACVTSDSLSGRPCSVPAQSTAQRSASPCLLLVGWRLPRHGESFSV
jgi:hypothetical protein